MTGAAARFGHWQAVVAAYQAERRLPSLVVGVLDAGALAWSGTAGAATTADTQYRIGSITKSMTAVLVLQCRDEGLLDLADPIGRYLPESGYGEATVRDLLAHVSGMQSEPVGPWWERSEGRSLEQLIMLNDGSGRVFKPKDVYHYSNLGYALLGQAVARIRGLAWEQLVEERLWRPLGMSRTSCLPVQPAASGYSVDHLAGTLTAEPSTVTLAMAPAGQAWSTTDDLARFAVFLGSGHPDVLSAATLGEMAKVHPPATGYGLGLRVLADVGLPHVGHLGSMPGFQSSLFVDRRTGQGVVALTNGTTGFSGVELTKQMLAESTPAAAVPWVPSMTVPAWVKELLGWWFWGNSAYEVRWENELLEFRDVARGGVDGRFDRQGDRIVGVEGYHRGETLHVVRRDDGSISHLDCATFIYTRAPYDAAAPIPGGHPIS